MHDRRAISANREYRGITVGGQTGYAAQCYDLVHKQNTAEQAWMYHILWEAEQLMEAARLGLAGK